MSVNKNNSQKFIITFESYGKEVSFYLPDSKDHIQKLIKREKDFYEKEMLHDIRNRVSPGTVAIDVGANIGNHTIFFSKICEMKVIALEPLLDSYRILNRNIELNGQKDRVTVLRKAAGHLPGRGEPIIADPMNLGECYIQERPVGQVEIILLDDLKPAGDVSVIKIDVEGMEIEVLKGATKLIQDTQPLIYVEARNQDSFRELNLLLSQLGYSSVLEFNWTPTFLFMPCKNSQQRFNVIIERLNQMQNVFKDDLKEIQDRTVNLERQIKDAGKHAHKLEARLANQLVEIAEQIKNARERGWKLEDRLQNQLVEINDEVKEIGEHTCKLDDKLENHNLRIEQQNKKLHKCIKEFEDKLKNHLFRAEQQSEEMVGDVVFYDSLNLSWEGWRRHQKVRLNTGGHLDILQNRSTPGVRKDNVRVDPGRLYRFTVRGSFQVKNKKAFLRVTDPDSDLLLCPLIFFSGDGEVLERHVTFMTLGKTHRLNLEVLIMDPCEGDTCSMHTAELRKCSVAEVYPTTASSLGEEIVASMASIPERESMLHDSILSLYPAVDRLRVFLNNYDHVPEFLLQDKIEVCRSQDYGDNGDAGKFFWVDNDSEGYRLICDDDIVYPPDYVFQMVNKLKQYKNRAIVGIHGILLKQPLKGYYDPNSRHVTRYGRECEQNYLVHVLGTGAVAYHAHAISLKRRFFMFRNMADIWLALEAQKQHVPMICTQRPKNWIIVSKGAQENLNIYSHSSSGKKTALDTSLVQSHVVRKNYPFTIQIPSDTHHKHLKLVMGVTTYNRRGYLQACLESFIKTRNIRYDWVVIVADDGSTDDTLNYLDNLDFPEELHIIKNSRRYACGQTNTIIELSQKVSFDIGFKVDDDLVFKKKGWDDLYIEVIRKSGYEHLCYMNDTHYRELRIKENPNFQFSPKHIDPSGLCEATANVFQCMGCLFTFTPEVLEKVGSADEESFPIRGQWHIDFSARCCRAGFNDETHFYDAKHSNKFISLQNNLSDNYRSSIEWGDEYAKTKEPKEMERRLRIIHDGSRIHIRLPEKVTSPRSTNINEFFDRIYVLNLDRRPDRWKGIKAQADKHGIKIHRFPAVDGTQEPHKSEWESYFQQDLVTHPKGIRRINSSFKYNLDYDSDVARVAYFEKRNQKKAIQSPGAWGYLKTMIKVLEQAIEEDLDSILVLDDDAVFHKNINKLFEQYIRQIPEEWKILQLGALQYHWDESWITWVTENVYKCNGCSLASHAVGIHHSAFPLLLNYCYRFDLPYDEGPLHKAKRIFSDQSFTFYPNLIIQNTVESDINSSEVQCREGRKKDNVYRWKLSDYYSSMSFREKLLDRPKPHILYLLYNFPTLSEAFIINEITGLMDAGFRTTIISLRDTRWQAKQHKKVKTYKLFEKTIYLDDYKKKIPADKRVEKGLRALSEHKQLTKNQKRRIKKYFFSKDHRKIYLVDFLKILDISQKEAPDILYCHFGNIGEIFLQLKTLLNVPFITYFHGYDFSKLPKEGISYLDLFKIGDRFFSNSNYTKNRIIELGCPEEKARVIGYPIDHRQFEYRERSMDDTVRILTIARLTKKKGLEYSIAAFAKVSKRYPNVKYTIVGDGELRDELEALVQTLEIGNKVEFLGFQTHEEIVSQLEKAHIFVLSSVTSDSGDTEDLGVVLLEAQLSGLPVVATHHNGFVDSVRDGKSGFLVPEKNVDALAKKILFLIENPASWTNFGKEGRGHVIARYSYETIMNKLAVEFENLLKTSPLRNGDRKYSNCLSENAIDSTANDVKFIVLGRSRTGSNMLITMLTSHPDIYVEKEILQRLGGNSVDRVLNLFYSRTPANKKAVGFKIFYYHPLDDKSGLIWDKLKRMENLRIIHLKRKNILRTLVSRKIAGKTDAWMEAESNKSRISLREKQVEFTKNELLQGFKETKDWEKQWGKMFKSNKILDVYYENLVRNPEAEFSKIISFLNLKPNKFETDLRRQNPEELNELISNYSSLKAAFKGTEWYPFFDDPEAYDYVREEVKPTGVEKSVLPNPHDFGDLFSLGRTSQLKGNHHEAISYFEKCIKLKHDSFETNKALGISYLKVGEFALAENAFKKTLTFEPDNIKMYCYLGKALRLQNKKEALIRLGFEICRRTGWRKWEQQGYIFLREFWFAGNIDIFTDHLKPFAHKEDIKALEIGSLEGMSCCWLIDHVLTSPTSSIYCIDPEFQPTFQDNTKKTLSSHRVHPIKGKSQDVLFQFPDGMFNFVFIDGWHVAWQVLIDALMSWPLLKAKGIVIFDDYLKEDQTGIGQSVKLGVNYFLHLFKGFYEILYSGKQVVLKKTHYGFHENLLQELSFFLKQVYKDTPNVEAWAHTLFDKRDHYRAIIEQFKIATENNPLVPWPPEIQKLS